MEAIREEIEICERVLAGETVNGVKIGDVGITAEWVARHLDNLRAVAAKS